MHLVSHKKSPNEDRSDEVKNFQIQKIRTKLLINTIRFITYKQINATPINITTKIMEGTHKEVNVLKIIERSYKYKFDLNPWTLNFLPPHGD